MQLSDYCPPASIPTRIWRSAWKIMKTFACDLVINFKVKAVCSGYTRSIHFLFQSLWDSWSILCTFRSSFFLWRISSALAAGWCRISPQQQTLTLSSLVGRWLIKQFSILWREKSIFMGAEITISLSFSTVRLSVFCLVTSNLSGRCLTLRS